MANKLRASGEILDKYRYISVAEAKKQMIAMLTELFISIDERHDDSDLIKAKYVKQLLQEKIEALKGDTK